ncbi:MAG: hypothetical protein JWN00_1462 [Actinomycetia bacterium]|nr:hypothetical protein [Actinomycetes bacterium]
MSEQVETYAQALRDELEHLWSDLAEAYRMSRADPPEKSMECENAIARIWAITDHVGPCPPGRISMPFLLTGMYEKVHAQIGIAATVPPKIVEQAREYVAATGRQ